MPTRANPSGLPTPGAFADQFAVDPATVYLNHGSFGACPRAVLEARQQHILRVERDAVRFYIHDLWPMLDRSRAALAPIAGCQPSDLVFVPNATTGVTTVLDQVLPTLDAGDEILVTAHEYTACINNTRRHAHQSGTTVVVADLPWPPGSPDAVYDAIMSRVTGRTRVALISLVTSSTGLRLPIERLIADLRAQGIETILDAAHGPGCVPLRIDEWGAAWTTGNCHKWLCAPKGAAFLHVRSDKQPGFRPLVLSNDAERLDDAARRTDRSAFMHEFDYCGTDDATARMTIADACDWITGLIPGGIDAVMNHNHALTIRARDIVCAELDIEPPAPVSMLGPMAALQLPEHAPDARTLWDRLYEQWRIQIPVWDTPSGRTVLRLSAQIYNSDEQYAYLAAALKAELS